MNKIWKILYWSITLARIAVVGLLFLNPLIAVVVSMFLDTVDAPAVFKVKHKWSFYTRYDKALDLWWYIFIVIYCRNLFIYPVILALFIFRAIGQVPAIFTTRHKILFWFPNVLENFFVLYLLVVYFWPQYLFYFVGWNVIIPIGIAFLSKIPQEFILHRFCPDNDWHPVIRKLYLKI